MGRCTARADASSAARLLAVQTYVLYGTLPCDRAVLVREEVEESTAVALIGDEDAQLRTPESSGPGAEFSAPVVGASDEDHNRARVGFQKSAKASDLRRSAFHAAGTITDVSLRLLYLIFDLVGAENRVLSSDQRLLG
jgi:hypothetical protein